MSDNERDDGGRFRSDHDDREYLAAVAEHEPAGTSEVAEAVGVTRQNAHHRLRRLEEGGAVTSKEIGTSLAWSLVTDRDAVDSVDPDDEFWEAETFEGDAISAEELDDVLYG